MRWIPFRSPVAQPVEQLAVNQFVAGSNPAGGAEKGKDLCLNPISPSFRPFTSCSKAYLRPPRCRVGLVHSDPVALVLCHFAPTHP